jgi:hypothetical protein
MLPLRDARCSGIVDTTGDAGHHTDPETVESEWNAELEWQFAECAHCRQRIARFRRLAGGTWFDRWGALYASDDLLDSL